MENALTVKHCITKEYWWNALSQSCPLLGHYIWLYYVDLFVRMNTNGCHCTEVYFFLWHVITAIPQRTCPCLVLCAAPCSVSSWKIDERTDDSYHSGKHHSLWRPSHSTILWTRTGQVVLGNYVYHLLYMWEDFFKLKAVGRGAFGGTDCSYPFFLITF